MGNDRKALLKAYWQLHNIHPHHLLPLESVLADELRSEKRDKYRTIMTMILAPGTGDKKLSECLGRLFKIHPSFDSLRDLEESQVRRLLGPTKDGGIGLGNPQGRNSARFIAVQSGYFGIWKETTTPENTQALVVKEGFGPKTVRLLDAYCWGNRDVFPLDQPALRALRTAGLYEEGSDIDKVRSDVETKLAGQKGVSLIDFHEMLRFIEQSSGKSKKGERGIIVGWNAWRLLCSKEQERITRDWRWLYDNLVKDEDIAKELWRFYRKISDQ